MSREDRKKNVFFTYSDVDDDDGSKTPTNKVDKRDRLSLFDVIGRDRELTEMSASTTMTTINVGSEPTSPDKIDTLTNVDTNGRPNNIDKNGRQNNDNLLESILLLGEQLRVYSSDFSTLRSRLSEVETSLCQSERRFETSFCQSECRLEMSRSRSEENFSEIVDNSKTNSGNGILLKV